MKLSFASVFLSVLMAGRTLAATYNIADNIQGNSFFNSFNFQAISDPTHGRVNYVSQANAQSQGLATISGNNIILRADAHTTLSASGPGRNSFRVQSNKQYSTHVAVFNVQHMPQGCGTWPAIWEVGANWPNEGEVDIVEGVNDQGPNQSTLHTNAGCSMPASRSETGHPTGNDCNTATTNNAGCGVQITDANSYGPSFNNNGGGWYAVERTGSFIKVWFWARNAGGIPSDVTSGASSVNTDNWGTPDAYFPSTNCNIGQHFGPHNIIINLTFCGDWAGSAYGSSGCPSSCNDYVNNNPSAFNNAYFEFPWIKVYT